MALRASSSSSSQSTNSTTTNWLLVGLPLFWHEASKSLSMEWEKWADLFAVAMMAKYSLSVNELTKSADETNPRVKAMLGDMPEEAANQKVVSMMFLSLGESGRKMFRDKYPETSIWTLQAMDTLNICHSCFRIERNRTLDRHNFLSRKQLPTKSLQQFWHALNGLEARCELGDITQTLAHDIVILNMNIKKVHETSCGTVC